jgi:hypothetical protein
MALQGEALNTVDDGAAPLIRVAATHDIPGDSQKAKGALEGETNPAAAHFKIGLRLSCF